jgi:hypothetical protein
VAGLPIDTVTRATGVAFDARGVLVGSVTAFGNPYTPDVEGSMGLMEGRIGALELQSADLSLTPAEHGMGLDLAAVFEGGELTVSGTVPVDIDLREDPSTWSAGAIDLQIAGEGVPLSLLSLADPGVVDATGTLDVRGGIGGTLADLQPKDIVASIADGAFAYSPIGLRLSKVTASVDASGRRLKLTELHADTSPLNRIGLVDQGQSTITLTGAANLDGGRPSELSARVALNDAWVMGTHDIGMRVGGDLLISGAWPALIVRSDKDIELVQGRITYDSNEALAAGALQPAPSLTIHRGTEFTRSVVEVVPPFYSDFQVDVGVDLNRSLEVYAQVAFFDELGVVTSKLTRGSVSARVGGGVHVALDEEGAPLLAGEVDILDGSVQLLRTSFQLEPGRLVFLGDDMGRTQLDLAASASVQGTPVAMRILGTADAPVLTTTSPGYDQTQVLLMLITGRPPESVAGEQARAANSQVEALASTAAALVASSVLSGTSAGALTIEPDGAVRVGAPWSSTVFTQFVVRPFADTEENRFSGSLDWTIAPRLVLELGAGDRYQWSDLSWEVRF